MNLIAAIVLAASQVTYPARTGPREFVVDQAALLKVEEAAEIQRICDDAFVQKRAPIAVCTIKSLADQGAAGWTMDRYASNLFSTWSGGSSDWSRAMLLLVSVGDRRAKIEVGSDVPASKDAEAQRVVDGSIVPNFKAGDYGKGILEGVRGLSSIAPGSIRPSGAPAPSPLLRPSSGCGSSLFTIVIIVAAVAFFGSVFRRRTSSWGPGHAYGMEGGSGCSPFTMGCLGSMVGNMLFSGRSYGGSSWRSSSWGGGRSWGGGSSGGGFSRRGGASGSW